jgi:hypothetical protein
MTQWTGRADRRTGISSIPNPQYANKTGNFCAN